MNSIQSYDGDDWIHTPLVEQSLYFPARRIAQIDPHQSRSMWMNATMEMMNV